MAKHKKAIIFMALAGLLFPPVWILLGILCLIWYLGEKE